MTTHLDPTRKHDFAFLIDVRDGNPNGDPDAGGMPRQDQLTSHGLITDVAIKRKIRKTVALINSIEHKPGYDIYVEAGVALNSQHERAYEANPKSTEAEARAWMCKSFFDVRMFGAVMTTGARDKTAGRVQGPMQLTFSRSIDPVTPFDIGITRVTRTRAEDTKETEMGSKHILPYALYLGEGHFSASLATGKNGTGVTTDDLAIFWQAFTNMFEHDRASSRGEMSLRGLYIFTHDNVFGRAPSRALLDRVQAKRKSDDEARSFDDYNIEVSETGLPGGISLTRLVG